MRYERGRGAERESGGLDAEERKAVLREAEAVRWHAEQLLQSRPRPATDWGPLDQMWRAAERIRRLLAGGEEDEGLHGGSPDGDGPARA